MRTHTRDLLQSVIGRLVNQPVSITTEIRGSQWIQSVPNSRFTRRWNPADRSPATGRAQAPEAPIQKSDDDQTLIDAARNLFDAEEISLGS